MNKTLLTIALALAATNSYAQSHHSSSEMPHGQLGASEEMDEHMEEMMDEDMDHSKMDHSNMMNMEGMSAVGMPAKGAKPNKVVHVILSDDMKITFRNKVQIKPDDVVQFVIMNTGKIDHEFAIGSAKEQLEHREMMKTMGNHMHDSGNAVTVKPGKAKQILWHFHGEKDVEFACNIPGHAEAGMVKKMKLE